MHGVNLEWLLEGKGRIFKSGDAAVSFRLPAAAAPLALAAWQIPSPAIILGAGDLGVDEAVDPASLVDRRSSRCDHHGAI